MHEDTSLCKIERGKQREGDRENLDLKQVLPTVSIIEALLLLLLLKSYYFKSMFR